MIIPGWPMGSVKVPGTVKFTNEVTDAFSELNYEAAFTAAFTTIGGNDDAFWAGQFGQYLKKNGVNSRLPLAYYEHKGLLAAYKKALLAVAPYMTVEGRAEVVAKGLDADANYVSTLISAHTTWADWVHYCQANGFPTLIDLALLYTMSALTSMLLGIVPGSGTLEVLLGNINTALAVNGVNKDLTDNTDFKCAVVVRQPNNIDAVPAAFVHYIHDSASETGMDCVDDSLVPAESASDRATKQFFVVPLMLSEDQHTRECVSAESCRELISVTGIYPNTRSTGRKSAMHFPAGPQFLSIFGLQPQPENLAGCLENYDEERTEFPG
jgi:hypothetical protein